jgi:hypothetical protein
MKTLSSVVGVELATTMHDDHRPGTMTDIGMHVVVESWRVVGGMSRGLEV